MMSNRRWSVPRRRVLENRQRDGEPTAVSPGTGTLEDAERTAIIAALKRHGGNRTAAAATELGDQPAEAALLAGGESGGSGLNYF